MRLLSWLLCAAAAVLPVLTSEEKSVSRPKRDFSEKRIVCYYTNWSVYRPGSAKYTPQNINPYLCTHLIYAFGGLSKDNALKPFDKYQDIEQGGYAKFNGLKTYNKKLKTMLAIGGWNEGSVRFSPLVADSERRRELVKNTVKFLRQNHFDGLDLDWEYPSFRDGGKPRDRDNYATLVQEFREEFERESEKTGRPRLLLTMAVPAGIEYIDKGYDIPKLNKYLDWMNILSYDYHSAFEPAINHHSPLFSLEEDDEYNFDAQLNIDHTVQHYIKLGADRSKLVLGIPTYGRSYTLFNPDATEIGSPADGPGEQGEATREKGYLAYYEICERVKSGGWKLENPNPEAMGPYAYKDNQWVGFDDVDIVKAKAKYVNDNDLGGIMFWSIDNDDFRGKCHNKPYPLIEAAKESLLASANDLVSSTRKETKQEQQESIPKTKARKSRLRTKSSTTTESPKAKASGFTTTTPQPPTTPDPGSDFVCKDEGFFPHPRDCKKYFWCLDSGPSSLGIVAHQFTCPSGLVFNKISDSCDYARNVICKTKSEASTTTSTTTTTTTTSRTTTARSRLVITASPPRTTTTTTTTETPDEEEEEEEEVEEDEEDPGTIKELIQLIKKLGGVEQLEKQLNLQNADGKEKIKPSLYSRVLQGRAQNRFRGVSDETTTQKYVSVFRNRPVRPQSPSTEEITTSSRSSEKPRYVTIQRNRPTKKPIVEKEIEEEEEAEEKEEEEEEEEVKPKVETPRSFRRRPTIDTTSEKEYVTLRRSKPPKEDEVTTQKYKNIVRVRSTTKAPVKEEEEEEEEEEEKEDEKALEEEEEIVEEDREEEELEGNEPGQKLKKYSSIVRDNKKQIPEEKESKVSGPQGPRNEYEESNTARDSILTGKDTVNTVNIKSSPIYTEIRRKQTTASPSDINVNSVNISHDDEKNKEESNEVTENETENESKDLQKRITTEIISKPTKPTFITPTQGRVTATTVQNRYEDTKISTFTERFITSPVTDSALTTKFLNRYKLLKRINPENPAHGLELNQSPQKERKFESSTAGTTTTTITNTDDKFITEAPRKFQFAPRKKPNILLQKPLDSTTEIFQITVPDFPSDALSDNTLGSPFSSATTKPATATESAVNFNIPRNDFLTTLKEKQLSSSTRYSVPSTSTQTTVVTSITESSITERRRILVPRKSVLKSGIATVSGTYENPEETTTPAPRFSGYRTILRPTTPKAETKTESKIRRFKATTTTEAPVTERKFVPKQKKNFKRTTEEPASASTATERFKFRSRNKPRQTESGPAERNNLLQTRFSNERRKRIFSKKEDDLEVEQTATFFEDFDSNDRVILGGAIKQTSEKDYLNADVYLRNLPAKESSGVKTEEEEPNKIGVTPASNTVGGRFVTTNPIFRNLRTRARNGPTNENVKSLENSSSNRNAFRNNFQTLRSRSDNKDGREKADEAIRTVDGKDSESVKRRPLQRNFRLRNKASAAYDANASSKSKEKALDEKVDVKPQIRNDLFSQRSSQSNFASSRSRAKQFLQTNENAEDLLSETNLESPDDNQPLPNINEIGEKSTEISKADGLKQKTTEAPAFNSPTQSAKPTTDARLRPLRVRTEDAAKASESATTADPTELSFESKKYEQVTKEVGPSVVETTSPSVGSTFGGKTGSASVATDLPVSSTFGTKIAPKPTAGLTTGSGVPTESATSSLAEKNKESGKISEFAGAPNYEKLRGRSRENLQQGTGNKTGAEGSSRARGKVKAIDSIFQATEGNAVTDGEKRSGRTFFTKDRRKVLVRTRPVQTPPEADEEENALEPPEEIASKTSSEKRVNQETVTNFRTRGRSTQSPPTGEQGNKRRTQLDRRRFRGESRTTTEKPDVKTETSVTVSKSSILLRRRLRPTTTTSTTTTTPKAFAEQVEDSSLEESKSLDETPDIQDLADPAVVAIHYLATVSPGPGASSVTSSLNPNSYPQTSDTYTVHVTPSDIASFSTPKIPSATPGSPASLRPTSILTLKPYTTPLITKQFAPKQSPSPFRAPPFRGAGIPLVTEEPYGPRSEILIQSRKQDTTPRAKPPTASIASAAVPQKAAEPKSRRLKPFSKVPKQEVGQAVTSSEPPVDYEYYDDDSDPLANIPASALKVKVHSDGYIECLDRGNFPHPFSCKKFISCAKMENNELLGWEYTCPKHLSFDPVGGICNWSAGLGCQH